MDQTEKNLEMDKDFLYIKELIEKEHWENALEQVKSSVIKAEKNPSQLRILEDYENLITAIINFEKSTPDSIQMEIKKVQKAFLSKGYELERFIYSYYLGLNYYRQGKEKDAFIHFMCAWEVAKEINPELKLKFLDKTIPLFIKANKSNNIIDFLKEKLSLIDKTANETEYIKTILLLITFLLQENELEAVMKYFELIKTIKFIPVDSIKNEIELQAENYIQNLIKKNDFNAAIEFIRTNDFSPDIYIHEFRSLYETFNKEPSLSLAQSLINLFSLQFSRPASLETIKIWRQEISLKIYNLLIESPEILLENEDYRSLIEFILINEQVARSFVNTVSKLTEDLLEDPTEKGIIAYFLYLNELLLSKGYHEIAKIVHSWISTTLDLRKMNIGKKRDPTIGDVKVVTIDYSTHQVASKELKLDETIICNILRRTEGTFAPLSLMEIYFEDCYKTNGNKANVRLCNQLSEFLDEISVIVYGFPDSLIKQEILHAIDIYTDTVASGYEFVLWDRMKRQEINLLANYPDQVTKTIINNLVANISIKNPSPFSRCLENTMARWEYFPALETRKVEYYETRVIALKPIFWLIIFNFLYLSHFESVYRRLPRNEQLNHKYLGELIRSNLNFYYQFQECLRFEPVEQFPWRNIRTDVIKYLKKMNEMIQLSDEELREIVKTSLWKSESSQILSDIIEIKNYCIHCSFNMPLGVKICPNCGKDVTKIPEEAPSIDFKTMGSFFGEKKKTPEDID